MLRVQMVLFASVGHQMSRGSDCKDIALLLILGRLITMIRHTHHNPMGLQGGESAALARLADQLSNKKWVADFEKVPLLYVSSLWAISCHVCTPKVNSL